MAHTGRGPGPLSNAVLRMRLPPALIVLLQDAPDRIEEPLALAPLDIVGLVLVGVPVLLGIWRGLWWQVIRFLGLVAAVLLARAFSLPVAEVFTERWGDDVPVRVLYGASWLVVFLLALGAATVLGHLGQRLLDAMQLGLANRVGGGLIGAATGLVVHLALLAVLVQLSTEQFLGRYVQGTYSERLVERVGITVPGVFSVEAAEEVRAVLGPERFPLGGRAAPAASGGPPSDAGGAPPGADDGPPPIPGGNRVR